MDSDCQQIAEAFRTMSRAAMAINEILGRRDDLNKSVPVDWPLQLSAGEFASECLGMAAHYTRPAPTVMPLSARSTRMGATWNAVRIAAGKHSGASGSTRTTRAVNLGLGNGRARPIVNVSVSSSPATARCLISTVSLRSVFGTRNGNGGNNPWGMRDVH